MKYPCIHCEKCSSYVGGYGGGGGYGPMRAFGNRSRPSPYDRPFERDRYPRPRYDELDEFAYDAPLKVFMRGI